MQISSHDIIYEDNHLIALNKRPGQIVQGDKTGDQPLSDALKDYLKQKYTKPGNVFCGVIHRLDRPVSGVVLFAKTGKALSRMNTLFRNRETEKIYWAIIRNKPPQIEAELHHYLVKNENLNKSFLSHPGKPGALSCSLRYKLLKSAERYSLLEVYPLTGRHHQIRVQLAAAGMPITGDVKYGDKRANEDASICLHARKLLFKHPVSGIQILIQAPVPDQKYWNLFE
ncbi:MAG: RluA family pseudouridine synthase [Candidatus Competibacteraceae bacterium]|nr:RluA family pseudouridine synthase [Candidatus Competibacteraceae bacterium]